MRRTLVSSADISAFQSHAHRWTHHIGATYALQVILKRRSRRQMPPQGLQKRPRTTEAGTYRTSKVRSDHAGPSWTPRAINSGFPECLPTPKAPRSRLPHHAAKCLSISFSGRLTRSLSYSAAIRLLVVSGMARRRSASAFGGATTKSL